MKNLILILTALIAFGCKNSNCQLKNEKSKADTVNITEIKEYLNNQARKDSLHGVVLIADKDKILLKKAFGYKDLSHTEKHSLESKIGLASMPKIFTAIAIIKLAESGEIKLNNIVENYLPEIKNQFLKDSVIIRQLLSHTSGLGNYWDYTNESDQEDLDKLYHLIVMKDSLKSHRKFRYSNS